jgi:hypothetical protein
MHENSLKLPLEMDQVVRLKDNSSSEFYVTRNVHFLKFDISTNNDTQYNTIK